ncbi:Carbohydrate esterase 4 protein [Tulasnella sp. 403]|nr:Carbohydrate esterase 4 protein [Tulasnella sp. 403]
MLSVARIVAVFLSVSALVAALPADISERDVQMDARKPKLAKVYTKCSKKGVVALTFNGGPTGNTDHIVQVLGRSNAKATFFVDGAGGNIESSTNSALIKEAYNAGHQIASLGYSGKSWTSQSESGLESDLAKLDASLQKIIGVKPAFARPSDGKTNDDSLQAAYNQKKSVALYDFDSKDGSSSSDAIEKAYQKVADKKPSNLLALNHETTDIAFTVLPYVIKAFQDKYKFVTVAECLGQSAYN